MRFVYADDLPLLDKVTAIATRVYGAGGISAGSKVREQIRRLEAAGYGHYPVCVAKTPYSFSTEPAARGAPSGHMLDIREARLAAGLGTHMRHPTGRKVLHSTFGSAGARPLEARSSARQAGAVSLTSLRASLTRSWRGLRRRRVLAQGHLQGQQAAPQRLVDLQLGRVGRQLV